MVVGIGGHHSCEIVDVSPIVWVVLIQDILLENEVEGDASRNIPKTSSFYHL